MLTIFLHYRCMSSAYYFFIDINVFCILVMFMLIYIVCRDVLLERDQLYFQRMGLLVIGLFVLSMLCRAADGVQLTGARIMNLTFNSLRYIALVTLAYLSFRFTLKLDSIYFKLTHSIRCVAVVPLVIVFFLALASPMTGWLFCVDESNHVVDGPLVSVYVTTVVLYMLAVSLRFILVMREKSDYFEFRKIIANFMLGLLPCLAQIVQFIFPKFPFLCVGVTFPFLLVFWEYQEQMISLDPLTKLNNRKQFYNYIENKLVQNNGKTHLFLFVMDLDYFKLINDTFGHLEGDHALKIVADAMRVVFGPSGGILCRYGGDEFVVVTDLPSASMALKLKKQLYEILAQKSTELEYLLSVSVGFAENVGEKETVDDFFNRADQDFYKEKKLHHKQMGES